MIRLTASFALLLMAIPAHAQQDSLLREAVRLVTEGQGDSARSVVRNRLRTLQTSDSLYPEALYTAGLVALEADSALKYFRRVSIEYSQSLWADRALLRLSQFAFAAGDYTAAQRAAERIILDYPFSEVRAAAAFWAGRAHLSAGDLIAACQRFNQAETGAGTDVELSNRARFYLQRCVNISIADTSAADTPTEAEIGEPTAAIYTVQVAAMRSVVAVDRIMTRLRSLGYGARVVRDPDGLLKVRVGQFNARNAAQRLADELSEKLGEDVFVVEQS